MADTEHDVAHADEQLLTSFGYKQELRRTLKLFSIFAVSFSVISVTTGIFTNFEFATSEFGAASIWLWPVAAVGAMILAFVLAELASRVPLAGYSYQWGGRLVGPGYGWFVGFNLLCCFALASGGETLLLLSPTIGTVLGLNVGNLTLMIWVSVIVLLLAGLINVVGVRLTARINNYSVSTEILGTLVLGILLLIAFLVHSHGCTGAASCSPTGRCMVSLPGMPPRSRCLWACSPSAGSRRAPTSVKKRSAYSAPWPGPSSVPSPSPGSSA